MLTAGPIGGAKRRRGRLSKRLRRKHKACDHERDDKQRGCVLELNEWIHGPSFLFPSSVESWIAGPEETKNQRGGESSA
jgi:hypothetical protein